VLNVFNLIQWRFDLLNPLLVPMAVYTVLSTPSNRDKNRKESLLDLQMDLRFFSPSLRKNLLSLNDDSA
jgi:hypothetical protein